MNASLRRSQSDVTPNWIRRTNTVLTAKMKQKFSVFLFICLAFVFLLLDLNLFKSIQSMRFDQNVSPNEDTKHHLILTNCPHDSYR